MTPKSRDQHFGNAVSTGTPPAFATTLTFDKPHRPRTSLRLLAPLAGVAL